MSNSPIISVKNISKKYNITHQQGGYVAIRDVMANIAKKPFSFLKKKVRKMTGRETKEEFWALKDINFEIHQGEAVGIIGANGAGKSTLLKILTGITPPTTGKIKMHGKVASLLEVGTGFHGELTGRENIFLNGAILGMTKNEIAKKFDAIVEFSGVEKFIDTPVKRYSSGMLVRLGFSVAAHMEPDILLVDEVLAVGDADFQKKCLGKMDEVTHEGGRTILFVSHNMDAIQKLCKKTILLKDGQIEMVGETKNVISRYLNNKKELTNTSLQDRTDRRGTGKVIFTNCEILLSDSKKIKLQISYLNKTNKEYKNIKVSVDIIDSNDLSLSNLTNNTLNQKIDLNKELGTIGLEINNINLTSGQYYISLFLAMDESNSEIFDWVSKATKITINNNNFYKTNKLPPIKSPVLLNFKYGMETKISKIL